MNEASEDRHYRLMAGIQDAMVACAALETAAGLQDDVHGLTRVVGDLIWAFTRNEGIYCGRLLYEAFASPTLDNTWHIARRRCTGPIAFRNLVLESRHRMLATAVVLAGPRSLRLKFLGHGRTWEEDIASISGRLAPHDRAEFGERQKHWAWRANPPD